MRPLTDNFLRSFELYPHLIEQCCDDRDIRVFNIALITNCAAYVESQLNERLQCLQTQKAFMEAAWEDIDAECDISGFKRSESISNKWNRIKEMQNSSDKWDNGNSIFSNFSALYSLRNEVLHYKCDYLETAEVPIKRIKNIMEQLCDEAPFGKKPFRSLLYESWCEHLLKQKTLTKWSINTTKKLMEAL